jgi:hypothetical protein
MTIPQRLALAFNILLLTFIVTWVAFFDGSPYLLFSALALACALSSAFLSRRWSNPAENVRTRASSNARNR